MNYWKYTSCYINILSLVFSIIVFLTVNLVLSEVSFKRARLRAGFSSNTMQENN